MYTKDQIEAQLKAHAKNAIFERDFMVAFNKHLNEKKSSSNQTLAEKKDWRDYRYEPEEKRNQPFVVPGDDHTFHKAKWDSFLHDACFYYDLPNLGEERQMRRKL
jgi:hypothetical protein